MPLHAVKLPAVAFKLSLAIALAGCFSPEDNDDPAQWTGAFSIADTLAIVADTPPSSDSAGTLTTHAVHYSCEGAQVRADTLENTRRYAVVDGHLYLWYGGYCRGSRFEGASSSLAGSWTRSSYLPTDTLPARYRGSCIDPGLLIGWTYEDYRESYEISATGITVKTSGRVCAVPQMIRNVFNLKAGYAVVESGCATATVKRLSTGRTLKIASSYAKELLTVRLASAGKTCASVVPADLSQKAPECPEKTSSAKTVRDCLEDLGFYGDEDDDD